MSFGNGGSTVISTIVLAALVIFSSGALRAQSCPSPALEIGAGSQYTFKDQPYISLIRWVVMGRRSPVVSAITNNGIWGAYLGSNPGSPTPNLLEMSFRAGGPVAKGTISDCWPGPTSLALAEAPSGAGRAATAWGGCGGPAEVLSMTAPGGQFQYDQRLSPPGLYPSTIAAASTSGGKYIAYFTDTNGTYALDVTNPQSSYDATPIGAMQTVSSWPGAIMLMALGDSSSDSFLVGVFNADKTVRAASIGSDGRLSPLSGTAQLSGTAGINGQPGAYYSYQTGASSWMIFVCVTGGVDVFSFDGSSISRLGTVANAVSSDPYEYIVVPGGAPEPILVAERKASHSIDIFSGGFLAGVSGAPSLATSIGALSTDLGGGFGAYVDDSNPGILYTYRPNNATTGYGLMTDTFDISCVTSPPSPNPTASFTLVNKSAQNRTDKANYVGDFVAFTDSSRAGSGGAITNWYVWSNYNSSTSIKGNADVSATSAPSLPNLVIPCTGGISGGNCSYSPGSISGTSLSEQFGELVSAGALDSTAATNSITIKVPQTHVVGQAQDGSVSMLSGGSLDASASDGSPTTFTWTFTDANSSPLSTTCLNAKCAPPALALNFTVAAGYAGGYQAPAVSGKIILADVAGTITVPSTVYSGAGTVPATFALQKGAGVTITSVTYQYDGGSATAFSTIPGLTSTVEVPLPGALSVGGHTLGFVVNYTGGANGTSASFSAPFQLSAVQYQPKAWMSRSQSTSAIDVCQTNLFAGGQTSCAASTGTLYLSDQGDAGKPGQPATWDFGDGSAVDSSHLTSDFVPHAYNATGTFTVKLTTAGITTTQKLTIGTITALSASISGPSGPIVNQSATFTGSASGGSGGGYTYSWTSSDGGSGSGASFNHTFTSTGGASVTLTVHDSASNSKAVTKSVTVGTSGGTGGGCGKDNMSICVSAAIAAPGAGVSDTFTASVQGVPSSQLAIGWTITGGGLNVTGIGTSFSYTFAAAGSYTVTASGAKIVGAAPIPLTSASLPVIVAPPAQCPPNCPPPSAEFTVTGATFSPYTNAYSAKAGDALTFVASDTGASTQFAWDFGDQTTGTGKSVTHAYASTGNFNVKLNASSQYGSAASLPTKFSISGQAFSALIVPGAGHLVKDTSGAYATELSLFNNSDSAVTVALDFEKTDPSIALDPTKLNYPPQGQAGNVTIPAHAGWTSPDVTSGLLGAGASDFGTLFIKYTGAAPSALARIYFSSGSGAPTYGTYLPVYPIGANGPILSGNSVKPQNIVGLKFDSDFTSGITLVAATPGGGNYDVSLYNEAGQQVGAPQHYTISAYQQVKIGASDFGLTPSDPGHIYYAIVNPSTGGSSQSIAIGTVTDNRTKDSLLLTDDTPRQVTAPGASATYYVTGVGRTDSGAKTDVYLLNTSAYPLTAVNIRFQYFDGTGEHVFQVPQLVTLGGGEAMQISDVITSLFPTISGQVVGNLRIDYQPAPDGAPLIIEGRNYTDLGAGSYGMQLPAYAATDGLVPGSASRIVLAGLHNDFNTSSNDYDYISRFGFVALGGYAVNAHVDAYDAATGDLFWSGDYNLNSATFGDFVYQPTTGDGTDAFTGHPAFNLVISATGANNGTPVAAFATVQDTHSKDLVFIPGKKPASQ